MMRPVRSRLHVRLFVWVSLTIVLTAGATFAMFRYLHGSTTPDRFMAQVAEFTGERFAEVWDDPAAVERLGRSLHERFDVDLIVSDENGAQRGRFGGECHGPSARIPVTQGARQLGSVTVCGRAFFHGPVALGVLLTLALGLWIGTWFIAHRITWPLRELSWVAREIGEGKLDARSRLASSREDEVGHLARSINEMARRIERQVSDQKELLAAVSHELRTPLQHLRVIVELAEQRGLGPEHLRKIEQEVHEIDDLIDRVLASSRLDFDAIKPSDLDAVELLHTALERVGATDVQVSLPETVPALRGDLNLLRRALANLLDNALRHGGGVSRVGISEQGSFVELFVEDRVGGEAATHFAQQWQRGRIQENRSSDGGLGLGLSLVERIAKTHGGQLLVSAASGGARVALRLPLQAPS